MEIFDYLRIARRWRWLLVLVPLLAAGATCAYVFLIPQYSASAYVSASGVVGSGGSQYSGPQGPTIFVNVFTATATSPMIANEVAAHTGASTPDVEHGVTVTQLSNSWQMQVTFTTPHKNLATPVIKTVVADTLDAMFAPQVALDEQQVTATERQLAAADAAITAFGAKTGTIAPDQLYATDLQDLGLLQQQETLAASSGKAAQAAAIATAVAKKQAQLNQVGGLLLQFDTLSSTKAAAVSAVGTAEQNLEAARAELAASEPSRVVAFTPTARASHTKRIVKDAIPAAAAGLVLAILFVAVVELISAGRARRRVTASLPEASVPLSRSETKVATHEPAVAPGTARAGAAAARR